MLNEKYLVFHYIDKLHTHTHTHTHTRIHVHYM